MLYLTGRGDFARRVIEHVGRDFGEDAVALRISVGERGRPACGSRRRAGHIPNTQKVSARRQNQHAGRVCSPQRDVHDLGEVHLGDRQN